MSGTSAGILFQTCLVPLSVAAFVLFAPFLQGPLSPPLGGPGPPPVCGFGSPFGRASSLALRRSFLIQESLERPPPPAGGAVPPAGWGPLSPPLRGSLPLLLLLPPLQSVVSAPRALPPLLRGPPLRAIGHHPLGLGISSSLGCPVLGSASPTVGFSRSSVPCVMFVGLSAILSAAFGISHVCPLFPMW